MRSSIFRSIIFAIIFTVSSAAVYSQSTAPSGEQPGRMFAGEVLKYDGKLTKIIRGISVAELTFTSSIPSGAEELLIKTEAVSKGTLLKLFRFSFLQQYESTVDLSAFRIQKTVKHDVQKDRVRDSEALFDYTQKRVTYVETDPKDKNRPPQRIASEIPEILSDMTTGIYYLRLQTLAIGKRFEISVSDSGLVYKVPVVVTARELQKSVLGSIWCFRVEPEIFGHDRLIEQKGKMVIWITDDLRHIPVRSLINSEFGKIEIKLKSAETSR